MKRRDALVALASGLFWQAIARAQQSGRTPVVGLLITHPPVDDVVVDFFRAAMRKYGYEDGKNVRLEVRTALGQLDQGPGTGRGTDPASGRRSRGRERSGAACGEADYAHDSHRDAWLHRRPGGHGIDRKLSPSRRQYHRGLQRQCGAERQAPRDPEGDAAEAFTNVAVLWDSFGKRQLDELQGAAHTLKIRLDLIEVMDANGLDGAFKSAKARKAGAVIMNFSPVFWVNRKRIAAIALEAGLPTISDMQILARSGCLLAYGSDGTYNWERGAYFVDRLLKGADCGGAASRATIEANVGGQSQDRKGPRHHDPAVDSGAGRTR